MMHKQKVEQLKAKIALLAAPVEQREPMPSETATQWNNSVEHQILKFALWILAALVEQCEPVLLVMIEPMKHWEPKFKLRMPTAASVTSSTQEEHMSMVASILMTSDTYRRP